MHPLSPCPRQPPRLPLPGVLAPLFVGSLGLLSGLVQGAEAARELPSGESVIFLPDHAGGGDKFIRVTAEIHGEDGTRFLRATLSICVWPREGEDAPPKATGDAPSWGCTLSPLSTLGIPSEDGAAQRFSPTWQEVVDAIQAVRPDLIDEGALKSVWLSLSAGDARGIYSEELFDNVSPENAQEAQRFRIGHCQTEGPACGWMAQGQPIEMALAPNPASDFVHYLDLDDDGYGAGEARVMHPRDVAAHRLTTGVGLAPLPDDCDDGDPASHPVARWYQDSDGDGYGLDPIYGGSVFRGCIPPEDAWTRFRGDCDDDAPDVHPGAEDIFVDGLGLGQDPDQDCGGTPGPDPTLGGPDGYERLDEALAHAAPGAIVYIFPPTGPAASSGWPTHDVRLPEGSTLIGVGGPEAAILDGQGISRVLRVEDPGSAPIVIEGVSLRNGVAPREADGRSYGGCLRSIRGSLTLRDVRLEGCAATTGGGAYIWGGDLTVEESVIRRNLAQFYGGGLWLESVAAEVRDTLVELNEARDPQGDTSGGGFYVYQGTGGEAVNLTRVVLRHNRAQGVERSYGGGLSIRRTSAVAAPISLVNCDIVANEADYSGGGIYALYAKMNLQGGRIAWNQLRSDHGNPSGGGIFLVSGADASLHQVQVQGNRSLRFGGALMVDNISRASVSGSAFEDNATIYGGAVSNSGHFDAEGVRFSGNSAALGGGYYAAPGAETDLLDCTFEGNESDQGSALYLSDAIALLERLTLRDAGAEGRSALWFEGEDGAEPTILDSDLCEGDPEARARLEALTERGASLLRGVEDPLCPAALAE